MWLVRLFFIIIAIAILVGFILYNPDEPVNLHFPWGDYYNVQLIFVCAVAFIIGMFVTFIYSVFYYLKIAGDIREKNRQIRNLEVELAALRNRSLEDLDEQTPEEKEQEE
jgi:predicted PurR-regulated permease PerM